MKKQTPSDQTRVIVIANVKGGAGKTGAAVPLAYCAAAEGSVIVLDLDPTPSATRWIHAADLASARLTVYAIGVNDLDQAVKAAREAGIDTVIVDTPPVMRDVIMLAMGQADLLIIPMHTGSGDVDNLIETIRLMALPMKANPKLQSMVVLNHTGTMPAVTRRTREGVEGLGLRVARTEVPFRQMYAEAKGEVPQGEHYPALWKEIGEVLA